MSLMSSLMRRVFKLPPTETRDVVVERNIEIAMPDGVILLADHYCPRRLAERPTILLRSIYTDRTKAGWECEVLAEQGFQVLVVSGRGVCGSGGEFTPFLAERDDGVAVLEWLRRQDWFNGELGTYGASYLGYTQWAVAEYAGAVLKAMSTQFIGSDLRRIFYPGEGFTLELWMWWMSMVDTQEKSIPRNLFNTLTGGRRRKNIARHLPLADIDRLVTGKRYRFWREWLEHEDPRDPWWNSGDHSGTVPAVTAPNHLVGGWFDFMLPGMIRDYEALQGAGRRPYLTVGPWSHFDAKGSAVGAREGIIWLRAHLLGERDRLRDAPVRIYVMGAGEWREYDSWPPSGIEKRKWHLQPGKGLSTEVPPDSEPDRYRYDPGDPTSSVGGAARSFGQGRCSRDNRSLEARADVLTYSSDVLETDLEIIGWVTAELFVRSSLEHTDFFVRLCDVEASGKSLNVCDGLRRLSPYSTPRAADGRVKVGVELWPTAYRFRKGHRIRVQVSSGSFPRWNRNLGSGEPLLTATRSLAAEQSVYHDPAHPSSVTLPVCVA